ncbi:pilus assembly protein CpaE [Vibrio tubiashii]|nr:pilus assembly protein CpaE [Vibrio tubiashii]
MKKQLGISIVEFTVVSTAILLVMLSIMEVSRYLNSLQVVNDVTRVAARLATVCRVEDRNDIGALVIPEYAPSGLTESMIIVDYLDASGAPVQGDLTNDSVFEQIKYVRARVVGFKYQFTGILSFINFTGLLDVPEFETVRPRENLGHHRRPTGSSSSTDC